jgi:hypothetical protein
MRETQQMGVFQQPVRNLEIEGCIWNDKYLAVTTARFFE